MLPTFPEAFNLADYYLFDRLREGRGGRVALRFGEHAFTYDEVAQRAAAVAGFLRNAGLARGARVLIALRDVPAFAWVFFGVLRAGGVVALANPDAPPESFDYLVRYVGPQFAFAPPRLAPLFAPFFEPGLEGGLDQRPGGPLELVLVAEPATGDDPRAKVEAGDDAWELEGLVEDLSAASADGLREKGRAPTHRDEPAIWLFTSGSTGRPKAAMHAHGDFAFNTEVFAKRTMGLREDDVCVSVPRLFFGYATGTNLMFPFAVGASVGLFAERPTPESLLDAIARYRPTVLTQVPTMMGKILEHDESLRARGEPGVDLASLRFSYSAGEALPGPLLARWRERFGSEVYDGIGSAEMFHIYASNRPGDVRAGSLGRAVEGYELRVLAEDAEGPGAPPLPAGDIGVLWVKGGSTAFGYWLDREKSHATFFGAWCRTGDLFHADAEGYLYYDGRADELLKVSGQFVAPAELEACLLAHEAVAEVAVIGADDAGLVKPKALVVVKATHGGRLASPESREALRRELKELARDRLAKHKYPRFVAFVSELPKNDRGKLDRKTLREREARGENPPEL
ncbi:MAG TPA: benzoate-CoA ligase family protein [Polyangiaceae bacterium]|nr:benzoate-CoA ligase family protein [Polyangiaceae bacterium]